MVAQIKREYDFKWIGRDKTGKRVEGSHRADSPVVVRSILIQQGIQPISVAKQKTKSSKGGKVNAQDVMLFARQMATMMQAGIPISESIGMQAAGLEKTSMRELLLVIKSDIDRGEGLTGALNHHPGIFSEMFRGLVGAGERSGTLERVFKQLALFMEKTQGIKKTIKKAMVYPAAVITIAMCITALILVKVVPVFAKMFAEQGRGLPAPTQLVVSISDAIQSKEFVFFILVVVGGVWVFKQMVQKNIALRYKLHSFMLKIPLVGKLISLANSANFSRTLATMYDAGTPMIAALNTVAGATTNLLFKEAVIKMKDNVSIGQELNFAMRQSQMFPEMVTHMVGIGEKSGNLSDMLMKTADIYEEDIDNTVGALMSLIEPFLIVFLGVIVGGIVVAMYLPLFSMADGM